MGQRYTGANRTGSRCLSRSKPTTAKAAMWPNSCQPPVVPRARFAPRGSIESTDTAAMATIKAIGMRVRGRETQCMRERKKQDGNRTCFGSLFAIVLVSVALGGGCDKGPRLQTAAAERTSDAPTDRSCATAEREVLELTRQIARLGKDVLAESLDLGEARTSEITSRDAAQCIESCTNLPRGDAAKCRSRCKEVTGVRRSIANKNLAARQKSCRDLLDTIRELAGSRAEIAGRCSISVPEDEISDAQACN